MRELSAMLADAALSTQTMRDKLAVRNEKSDHLYAIAAQKWIH
jgi:hypothetical protein